jgi:ferritin-like metal-binding protein YciE
MKKMIKTLGDVLAMELSALLAGEVILKRKIEGIISDAPSGRLKEILQRYSESSGDKRLKLDRMFSYLMVEPSLVNTSIDKLLDETLQRIKYILSDSIKTRVIISDFEQINHFKITAYKTALLYSLELELDTVPDLLHEIIEWERKTRKALNDLYLEEFNTSCKEPHVVFK